MDQIHLISIIFIVVFLILAFFHIRYFLPFVFSENQSGNKQKAEEAVSIIICAHNELENLQENLPLFLNQIYGQYEVLVVNDRSHDGSQNWLLAQQKKHTHLKIIHVVETPENYNPKKYALTRGIENAGNDILLLSDADCQPISKHWVDRMARSFTKSTSFVLGVSLYKKQKGFLNQFIRFETLQTALIYLSFAFKNEPYMGVGRNLAYRKSFFLKNGGFENIKAIMGGDDDLWVNAYANEENTKICTDPESLTFSKPKEDWHSFFSQKKRHLSVGKHYKLADQLKLGIFHLAQFLLWILFISGLVLGNPTDCLILGFLFFMYLIGQYVVFYNLSINFGIKFKEYILPILEFCFVGYYWIWGIYASLTKHLKWK